MKCMNEENEERNQNITLIHICSIKEKCNVGTYMLLFWTQGATKSGICCQKMRLDEVCIKIFILKKIRPC